MNARPKHAGGDGSGDAFADSAGAYVLGALSPEDRAAFEQHLRGCARCEAAVAEFAGLPGLLALIPAAEAEAIAAGPETARGRGVLPSPVPAPAPGEEMPERLVQTVLAKVRTRRRRVRIASVAAGLAAAACLVVGVLLGTRPSGGAPPPAAGSVATMRAVNGASASPVVATARLTATDWGTKISVRCHERERSGAAGRGGAGYGAGGVPASPASAGVSAGPTGRGDYYALVVRGADGRTEQIATWMAIPGQDAVVDAGTSMPRDRIRLLEIRSLAGTPILRLTL